MLPSSYYTIDTDLRCGKLMCLRSCCDLKELRYVKQTLDLLQSDDDLIILHKLLCACRVDTDQVPAIQQQPPGSPALPPSSQASCSAKLSGWLAQYRGPLNALQTILLAMSATSIPGFDQAVSLTILALETIEDMADDPGESFLGNQITEACNALATVERFKRTLLNALPAGSESIMKALNSIDIGSALSLGCCPEAVLHLDEPIGPIPVSGPPPTSSGNPYRKGAPSA